MLSPYVFSRILDLLFILDPIFTLFSLTIVAFYPCFAVDLGYNMERTRVAHFNNLVRYGTVPGSGIYGTIPRSTQMVPYHGTVHTAQGQKIAPASTRFPKNFGIMSMRNRAWLFIPKFFGPEILEFCPRSNQRKKLEFRAQLAARAQNADFSWKSDEVRTRARPHARVRCPAAARASSRDREC